MIAIKYDDREVFPWVVWVGDFLWCKCRTRGGALDRQARLKKAFAAYGGE